MESVPNQKEEKNTEQEAFNLAKKSLYDTYVAKYQEIVSIVHSMGLPPYLFQNISYNLDTFHLWMNEAFGMMQIQPPSNPSPIAEAAKNFDDSPITRDHLVANGN